MYDPQVQSAGSDPELGSRTVRKISFRLLPFLAVCYATAYIDRANVSFAALQMNRDLHFSASVYGFGAGLFFLSYAACEIPANLLLMRFGARRWIARIMITWGLLALAMMFITRAREFYILRFFLGMAEAGFFPGVIYYLTLWFPQVACARAISRFYAAVPISNILMASISGLLLGLHGRMGLAGWQWLFLVEAIPAVLLGLVVLFVLLDGPAHAGWLSAQERDWIAHRLGNESAAKAHHSASALRGMLRDSRVWQFGFFMFLLFTASHAYTFSTPLLLRDLTHYRDSTIGFIVAGISVFAATGVFVNGTLASQSKSPYPFIFVPAVLVVLGCLGTGLLHRPLLVICSLALIPIGFNSVFGPLYATVASFLDKQGAAAGLAFVNTLGIMGGFIGPYYVGLVKDVAGSYQKGFFSLGVFCLASVFLSLTIWRNASSSTVSPYHLTGLPSLPGSGEVSQAEN